MASADAELFGPHAKDIGISADLAKSTLDRSLAEPRNVLRVGETISDKIADPIACAR